MIEHIEAFLTERIGLHVPSIGRSAVTRAVRMRMRDTRLSDQQAYWHRLNTEPEEQQSLIDAVVVPETSFFRYPDSFAALATHASSRRDATPLRILSLPCATGEEPYSIAMTLLDAGVPASRIRIEALDISPRVLRIAETARYPARSFRGNAAICAHHFSVSSGEYELNRDARSCVTFHLGNLLDPALHGTLGAPFDIVFCRNLLIYFDAPTRATAIDALKRLLRPDGILFAAPAEAGLLTEAGLHSIGQRQAVTFTHPRPQPAPIAAAVRKPLATPATAKREVKPPVARAHRPVPEPAATPSVPQAAPNEDERLAAAIALAESGNTHAARAAFEELLILGPSAAVYFWLGLLHDQGGSTTLALDYYRKALYLDPSHVETMGHLSLLLAARGDHAGARALRLRANASANGGSA